MNEELRCALDVILTMHPWITVEETLPGQCYSFIYVTWDDQKFGVAIDLADSIDDELAYSRFKDAIAAVERNVLRHFSKRN